MNEAIPSWVSLPKAVSLLRELLGSPNFPHEGLDSVCRQLQYAVERKAVEHRIAGWNMRRSQWDFLGDAASSADPAKRRFPASMEERGGRVSVHDWVLAKVDWTDGTVMNIGGHRSAIEVRWGEVELWAQRAIRGLPEHLRTVQRKAVVADGRVTSSADPALAPSDITGIHQEASKQKELSIEHSASTIPSRPGAQLDVEPRPEPTERNMSLWFKLRQSTWPVDAKTPSEAEDLKAARKHFAGTISREKLREIRREATSEKWRSVGAKRKPRIGPTAK